MHTLQQLLSGELAGTKRLKLSCGLTEIPEQVFELADTLEILDLSGNSLTNLPAHFPLLRNLKIVFFSDNLFTELPAVLASCPKLEMVGFKANRIKDIPAEALFPNLRWLILTNNCIETIPASIGRCTRLQKCMLAGNLLQTLPREMANCTSIELLRISANRITTLPEWLYTLPRLSWLAVAGNPCCIAKETQDTLVEIGWGDLLVTELLGEGASGFVSKAIWQRVEPTGPGKEVAIKLFKGEVTSDGLPGEEMKISLATGQHPNLVPVLGRLTGHPEGKQGLVYDLIPPACVILGNPPGFDTCTRDTFPEGSVFSLAKVVAVVQAMASVGAHLHARHIMHGDLYCHNILTDEAGDVLLVDYGAASFYHATAAEAANAFERMEVRAFGCLIDDLLQHIDSREIAAPAVDVLEQLRAACWQEDIGKRPGFGEICNQLSLIITTAG